MPPFSRAVARAWARVTRSVSRLRATRAGHALSRFSRAHGGVLAGGIAYRALLSIASGVVAATTMTAVVVGQRPEARAAVLRFLRTAVPGAVGADGSGGLISDATLRTSPATGVAGVVALAILLATSTRYVASLRAATHAMLGAETRSIPVRKGIEAAATAVLGAMAVLAAGLQALGSVLAVSAGIPAHGVAARVGVVAAAWLFDLGFVLVVYVVLGRVARPYRRVVPAAVVVAGAIGVLRGASTLLVTGAVGNPILAPFAAVVTLLVWADGVARLVLLGAAWLGSGPARPRS